MQFPKHLFRFILVLLASVFLFASAKAQQLNYQGVARKPDGTPMANQAITVKLTIPGTSFSETHSVTTNAFGLFKIDVGSISSLAGINWGGVRKSLTVEINSTSLGTSVLNYVPYAIYANQWNGFSIIGTPSSGQVLKWNGTAWAPGTDNSGSVAVNPPIIPTTVAGVTTLSILQASSTTDGYLSKADWDSFANKLNSNLPNGNILVGNALNTATAVPMSGDVTLSNTGATTIGASKVTNTMLAGSIDATKLADGSVNNTELQYINSLTSNVQTQLDSKQTATLSNGKILVGDATNKAAAVTMSGDVSIDNTGATTIGASKVTNTMLAGSIDATKLADGSVNNTELQYINSLTSNVQTQLDSKQTSTLANGNILVGNALNTATAVPMSGDVTLSNTGATAIGSGSVTYTKIQNVSTTDKVLGRISSGAGVIEEISTTGSGDVVRANSPTLTGAITSSGSVAITNSTSSTNSTTGALVVSGGVGISDNLNVSGNISAGGNTGFNWDNTNKYLGIGTNNPEVPLQIESKSNFSNVVKTYWTGYSDLAGGTVTNTTTADIPNLSILSKGSILTRGVLMTSGVLSNSDNRIKNIQSISNSKNDLKNLEKIQITDYQYKDYIQKGNQTIKKVIAQQVESVYPNAVSKTVNFIPNIYALSKGFSFQKDTANLTLDKAPDLVPGDRLKLFNDRDEESIGRVVAVNGNSLSLIGLDQSKFTDRVFVYGKEVNDFRVVDYDALSMLNVSATQELAKRSEAQAKEIEQLKKEKEEQEVRIERIEEELKKLLKIKGNK